MNYYIQGNTKRADEIRAAFERLGIDTTAINVGDEDFIYFSSNGLLHFEEFSNTLLNVFKTHPDYQELKLPVKPKFKDGDVLVTTKIRGYPFIYRKPDFNNDLAYYYAGINGDGNLSIGWPKRTLCHFGLITDAVIAGQGQRDLLFNKMKEAGYEWDADKKELRKIIEPKFKVGDNIKNGNQIDTIAEIDNYTQRYYCESGKTISFVNQDLWKLDTKPHYDIKNFKPFDKVLVRYYSDENWKCGLFSHLSTNSGAKFVCVGSLYIQCIPFAGNEHLLGTTDMPDEYYINW